MLVEEVGRKGDRIQAGLWIQWRTVTVDPCVCSLLKCQSFKNNYFQFSIAFILNSRGSVLIEATKPSSTVEMISNLQKQELESTIPRSCQKPDVVA